MSENTTESDGARPTGEVEKVIEKLRDRGEMIVEDELLEGCHAYGHGLLDAADAVEGVIADEQ